jgi:ribose-phosphate pyrophosphokinase
MARRGWSWSHGDRSVDVSLSDPQQIAGRPVLLVDDIVSSGGTLTACAKALAAAGTTAVDAVVTHALFSAETTAVLMSAGIRSIRSTNSVSHPTNAIALDNILAEALRNERSNIATGAMS